MWISLDYTLLKGKIIYEIQNLSGHFKFHAHKFMKTTIAATYNAKLYDSTDNLLKIAQTNNDTVAQNIFAFISFLFTYL